MSDVLYFGGSIITMETPLLVSALRVINGKISALGSYKTLKQNCTPATLFYDLKGSALLPGFIDSHGHILSLGATLPLVSLKEATSFEEIINMLQQHIKKNQLRNKEWVIGFGYDPSLLKEGENPTRHLLNKASSRHPILISHASGHMGVLNSMALSLLGITEKSKNPSGGLIGREKDGKTPNGYLEENAFFQVAAKLPSPSKSQQQAFLKQAEAIYLQHGITTAQEGRVLPSNLPLLTTAAKEKDFSLDVVAYLDLASYLEESIPPSFSSYHNHFRIGGYKIFLDGSPQAKTAWLSKPYLGSPNEKGYPIYSNEQVMSFCKKAITERAQLLCHCNGDAACHQFVFAYERALHDFSCPPALHPVMIHAQLLPPALLPRLKQLGIIPSYFVDHTYFWGDTHLKNLGKERACKISPLKSTQEAGLPFTLHQDCPVLPPDMIRTLWCATNRKTREGILLGEEECISILEGLKALTLYGAYQYGEENSKGSLALGKQADFVILNQNPLAMKKEDLLQLKILATIKNGKTLFPPSSH